jgi:PPM family protein phosphatase
MHTPVFEMFDHPVIHARVAGATHPGRRRSENQDNYLISDLSAVHAGITLRPDAPNGMAGDATIDVGLRGAVLLVADGMGGAAAGRLASGLACTFVLAELQDGWHQDVDLAAPRFAWRLRQAVEKANSRIYQHAQRNAETMGMGSTITVAGVLDGTVYVAQIGDSRAYLVRGDTVTQLTRDQSLVQQMVDAGALSPEDAERSTQGNIILQALGVGPSVQVDVTSQELRRDDYLVLCSDGLHRVVRPEEIAATIASLGSPQSVCDALVELANERGGPDNVTVVCSHFGGTALPAPQPTDVVERAPYRVVEPDNPA